MKQLQVPFLLLAGDTILNVIAETLDGVASHKIDVTPWRGNESKPEARFAIAYGPENIFLKYYVIESNPRAVYTKPNDPVYKDSCVEFFIALEEDDNYYNFEFNFLGNVLVGYGAGAKDRLMLPVTLVKKIKAQTVLRLLNEGDEPMVNWELTLVIPFDLFHFHRITSLKGKVCSVNFNKCGDDLPDPHFLTWSDIQTEYPDFHVPEFFGKMEFARENGTLLKD